MAWDDAPPTAQEIKSAPAWDAAPPTKEELAGKSSPSWLDKSVPVVGGTPRGYIQGGLNVLPTAGALGGGIIGGTAGAAAGPVGSLAAGTGGAALGGATGEGLKKLGEHYILGKEQEPGEYLTAEGKGMLHGAEQEMGGQVLSKGLGLVKGIPAALKDAAEATPVSSEEAKSVYDPFLKTSRVPGQSVEDMTPLNANLSKEPTVEVPVKTLKQLLAEKASGALDTAGSAMSKVGDVAGKVLPYAAKGVGAASGVHGYALGEALTSAPAKAGALIMKDASGNFIATPEGMGLLTRGAIEARDKSSHSPQEQSK